MLNAQNLTVCLKLIAIGPQLWTYGMGIGQEKCVFSATKNGINLKK